jgi:hypothetical protein
MRRMIAAVAIAAGLSIGAATIQEDTTTARGEAVAPAASVVPAPCSDRSELRQLLSTQRWRIKRPMAGHPPPCEGLASFKDKLDLRHHRWRVYRSLTPYQGCSGGGKWLTHTAVPGYVVSHESGCEWGAVNPSSGACGPYQLNGWTSCDTSSWADKMRHHAMARYVLRVQGLSDAWTSNW